jgi:hypothetical protein
MISCCKSNDYFQSTQKSVACTGKYISMTPVHATSSTALRASFSLSRHPLRLARVRVATFHSEGETKHTPSPFFSFVSPFIINYFFRIGRKEKNGV